MMKPMATRIDWVVTALYLGLGALFAPLLVWLVGKTAGSDQLLHALMVLGLAVYVLGREMRWEGILAFSWAAPAKALFLASCSLLALAGVWRVGLLTLPAFTCYLASLAVWVTGRPAWRAALALVVAFSTFTLLAIFLPVADWPLRQVAGTLAAWIFNAAGSEASLALVRSEGEPMLLLIQAGRPYNVAAECNGFGLLTSSLILAVLLTIHRRVGWLDSIVLLLSAVTVALLCNVARILVIVLLAPRVGSSYFLMHEVVGLLFFYGGIGFLWWVLIGFGRPPAGPPDPASSAN